MLFEKTRISALILNVSDVLKWHGDVLKLLDDLGDVLEEDILSEETEINI